MGKSELSINEQYKFYLKKRNNFLFFNIGLLIALIGLFLVLFRYDVEWDTMVSLFLPIIVLLLVFITWYRQRYNYYLMQLDYYRMLKDDLGLIQLKRPIFTQSFIDKFSADGFKDASRYDDFKLYYQFIPKVKTLVNSGQVLVCIILAVDKQFDFYDDRVDEIIQSLYQSYKDEKKVRKQIVLQFKKYDQYNEESKNEINQIINFKAADNHLIHLTIGYFHKNKQIYFLRPIKRYPNKFYYYAVELIKKYTGFIEEVNNGK